VPRDGICCYNTNLPDRRLAFYNVFGQMLGRFTVTPSTVIVELLRPPAAEAILILPEMIYENRVPEL
jgi:hypothetical protein